MTAEQIYAVLDRHGLTPPVHFNAAPSQWITALDKIETELATEVFALQDKIDDLEETLADIQSLSETRAAS